MHKKPIELVDPSKWKLTDSRLTAGNLHVTELGPQNVGGLGSLWGH